MARLPQPGSDNGTWGDILNDYLSQTHKSDGTLKSDVVTRSAIAPDAISATEIADGSIQEAKLSSAVQSKLNAQSGSVAWSDITGKPAVIAAGATQAVARSTIGAGTGNSSVVVNGSPVTTYNVDTTPLGAHDVGAYTQAEVDDAIDAAVANAGGGSYPISSDDASETNYTSTTWTPISGLSVIKNIATTAEVYRVELVLDLAAYAANSATMVLVPTVDSSGQPKSFPVKIPVNGMRVTMTLTWITSGLSAGTHTFGYAAYLTGDTTTMNYQIGTGTSLFVQRVA